jgi:hypothetical protein
MNSSLTEGLRSSLRRIENEVGGARWLISEGRNDRLISVIDAYLLQVGP